MTEIEKTAEWLKSERLALVKLSNEINTIVFAQNLKCVDNAKYYLEYNVGMSGNLIELRIVDATSCNTIEKIDIWCLASIFEYAYFGFTDTEKVKENVINAKLTLKSMKKLAEKYIKLNAK